MNDYCWACHREIFRRPMKLVEFMLLIIKHNRFKKPNVLKQYSRVGITVINLTAAFITFRLGITV